MALSQKVWFLISLFLNFYDSETSPSALALQISSDLVSATYFAITEIHLPHGQKLTSDVNYGRHVYGRQYASHIWQLLQPTTGNNVQKNTTMLTICAKYFDMAKRKRKDVRE